MDIQMIVTYIAVDLLCILMASVMALHLDSDFGRESEVNALQKALAAYCGFLVFGLLWLLTQNGYLPYHPFVVWGSNILSLWLMNMTAFYWFVFAVTKLSGEQAASHRAGYALAALPIPLALAACLASPWTGWVFSISESGVYTRGPWFALASSVGYLYDTAVMVYAIYCALHEKQEERKKLCWVIGTFILFPMTAGAIQIAVSGTPILAPAIMVAFFLVFVTIQSSQIYNDALTGLNNRKRTFAYLERELAAAGPEHTIGVYMLDVDGFKEINDRYGHVEGDTALKLIAAELSRLAARFNLFAARYGGDEFIMVDADRSHADAQQIAEELNRELALCCAAEKKKYRLTVSLGYALVGENGRTANDAVRAADEQLYRIKKKQSSEAKAEKTVQ